MIEGEMEKVFEEGEEKMEMEREGRREEREQED